MAAEQVALAWLVVIRDSDGHPGNQIDYWLHKGWEDLDEVSKSDVAFEWLWTRRDDMACIFKRLEDAVAAVLLLEGRWKDHLRISIEEAPAWQVTAALRGPTTPSAT